MPVSFHRERLRQALVDAPPDAPLPAQRSAAIALVLLEVDATLELLLIERAERSGDPWSGHMALPGGHLEPTDADLGATADRETLEEVGLDLQRFGERLGRLADYAPIGGGPIAVRPFVYLLRARPVLALSDEVKKALWVPIGPLQRGERETTFSFSRAGEERQFPAWDIDGHIVWGLTYRVLDEFLRRFNEVSGFESATLDNSQQAR